MKNQKIMINQKKFNKSLRSLPSNSSSQLWLSRCSLEARAERARFETPVQLTDGHDIPKDPFRWPRQSWGAHPWPANVQRWSITVNENISEKCVQIED